MCIYIYIFAYVFTYIYICILFFIIRYIRVFFRLNYTGLHIDTKVGPSVFHGNLVTQILEKWQDSSHTCVMLTGDAPLTALSVAVEVRIQIHPHGEEEWKFPVIFTRFALNLPTSSKKTSPLGFKSWVLFKLLVMLFVFLRRCFMLSIFCGSILAACEPPHWERHKLSICWYLALDLGDQISGFLVGVYLLGQWLNGLNFLGLHI